MATIIGQPKRTLQNTSEWFTWSLPEIRILAQLTALATTQCRE
jgi:hypothetical protein